MQSLTRAANRQINEPSPTCTIAAVSTQQSQGLGSLADESIDLNEILVSSPEATFFITVEGDSMVDSFIPAKALLLVDRAAKASSGDIVVAIVNGEFTVKRLLRTHVGTFLSPANPNYKPVKITPEMNFQVWGLVSRIIIDPRDV